MPGEAWQSAWVEVLPDFSNFKKNANSEMSTVLGAAGAAGGSVAGKQMTGGILGAVGKLAGPLLAVFAALGIGTLIGETIGNSINYALDSIDLASSLSETKSAVDVLFGDAAKDIKAFAGTSLDFGQTEQEALSAAQTFGIFAKAAGLTGKPLAGFSTDLVGLSADLASFFNTDSQTAIDAIGAGLRGESEPLRQFGVLLDDATLKQRALELGIYDGSGALTSQQRILAAQAEIFAQTADAQGDVERTSGGLAFQQKKFAAALETTQAALGEKLLPAFTTFLTIANDKLIPILGTVIEKVGPILADALVESAPAFEELITALAPLIPDLVKLGVEVLPLLVQGAILLMPFLIDWAANTASVYGAVNDIIGLLSGDTTILEFAANSSAAGGSMFELARTIVSYFTDLLAGFRNFSVSVANIAIDAFNGLGKALVGAVNAVSGLTGISASWKTLAHLYIDGPSEDTRGGGAGGRRAMAEGAYVPSRPGGVAATVGEGRFDEAVIPLSTTVLAQIGAGIANASATTQRDLPPIQIINPDPYVVAAMLQQRLGGRLRTA